MKISDIFSAFSNAEKHFKDHPDMPECHQKTADARGKKTSGKTSNCSNLGETSNIFTNFPRKKYQGQKNTEYLVVSKDINDTAIDRN